jgi:hypothetical protein
VQSSFKSKLISNFQKNNKEEEEKKVDQHLSILLTPFEKHIFFYGYYLYPSFWKVKSILSATNLVNEI